MGDLSECVVTFEQTREELEEIERRLAERYELRGKPIRLALIEMDKKGLLREDELVADWHEAYSSYLDWVQATRKLADKPPPPGEKTRSKGKRQEAACAASLLFVACRRASSKVMARWRSIRFSSGSTIDSFRA